MPQNSKNKQIKNTSYMTQLTILKTEKDSEVYKSKIPIDSLPGELYHWCHCIRCKIHMTV